MKLSYLCAPSTGSIEQWLPIIWKLNNKDFEFDIIIPKPMTAQQFDINNQFEFDICEKLLKKKLN